MSIKDNSARKRILKANSQIRAIQRRLTADLMGALVKINCDKRGTHSRRRYKAGTEFVVYDLIVEGRDVTVWLSRADESPPAFELSVWLHEVEFLPNKRKVNQ